MYLHACLYTLAFEDTITNCKKFYFPVIQVNSNTSTK